jgi:hypothetical protein
MHVKETPANVNDFSMADKNNIRFAGQLFLMETVSEAESMNNRPYLHLRLGVAVTNPRHVETALLGG